MYYNSLEIMMTACAVHDANASKFSLDKWIEYSPTKWIGHPLTKWIGHSLTKWIGHSLTKWIGHSLTKRKKEKKYAGLLAETGVEVIWA